MNNRLVFIHFTVAVMCFFAWGTGAKTSVSLMTADYLQEMISGHTVDFDFILLDVRDEMEVEGGIIASKYCKPYHMSWNFDEVSENYALLPKEMPIVVYCRSGNRSAQAANFLLEKGFTSVASLSQGINSYKGALADSTEFKPLTALPESSYFGDTMTSTVQVPQKHRAVIISAPTQTNRRFNLQGRAVQQTAGQRGAPVYILERIGEQPTGSVCGIRRLIQER